MKPPSGGPITGPIRAGTVTQAMALTSALLSMERSNTSRPTEKPRHMDLGKAWMFFRMKLFAGLSLPNPQSTTVKEPA